MKNKGGKKQRANQEGGVGGVDAANQAAKESKAVQMKQNRKGQYGIKHSEEPFLKGLTEQEKEVPQFINLNQFVSSRAYELRHFTNILKGKVTSKMEIQLIARHLRRRCMAHNYYRIPMRIRFRALHELAPNEAEVLSRSKCRRHRRKLRYLLNAFELRQKQSGAWMESHIWHAKRFHMASRWGVKYPTRCSDKSDRSTYRLV